jgi:Periplasmic copper-binding protein (NosD)
MSRLTVIFEALVRGGNALIGKRRSWLGLAGIAAASMLAQPSMATIVGTCKTGVQYPTIQQAVNKTPNGGTVSICPGTYPEQVTITTSMSLVGLTVNTDGSQEVVITSPSGGVVANTNDLYTADGTQPIAAQILIEVPSTPANAPEPIVNLSNLIVDGSNNQISGCAPDLMGIFYENASGTVNHVVVRNQALTTSLNGCQSGQGIYVESGYSVPGGTAIVTVENSSVHGYQKNGITADGAGTTFTISGNDVVGQGPTSGAAENGLQLSDGAQGTVYNNRVVDDIWTGGGEASGILVYDTGQLTIQSNTVSDTQYGIVVFTDGTVYDPNNKYADAASNVITSNQVSATHINDGIDLCSDKNTAKSNTVVASDASGIHEDSTCTDTEGNPTGTGDTISGNTVIEACAGVLLGNSGTAPTSGSYYDVVQQTYAGDTCPAGAGSAAKRATKPAPQWMR